MIDFRKKGQNFELIARRRKRWNGLESDVNTVFNDYRAIQKNNYSYREDERKEKYYQKNIQTEIYDALGCILGTLTRISKGIL